MSVKINDFGDCQTSVGGTGTTSCDLLSFGDLLGQGVLRKGTTFAITGEIDLNGRVRAIGGLDSKVEGAKAAGVKTVLCPLQNEEEVKKIRAGDHPPEDDNFKIIMVDSIYEVIDLIYETSIASLSKNYFCNYSQGNSI